MTRERYDVIIIGAGVIGCSIARALARYELQVGVLEKANDVSCGASKANSGIIHGGYDAKHGSLKSELVRQGNRAFPALEKELHFGYRECGSIVVGFDEADREKLEELMENGRLNGVDDLEWIGQEKLRQMEPAISDKALFGLYCPSAGVASPYELTIALAENAIQNGVDIFLNQEVIDIQKNEDTFNIKTSEKTYRAPYVINAAGAYADYINEMLHEKSFSIIPRKGEYILMHKSQGYLAQHVLFQAPSILGKGILVTATYHGNLMLGPNASEVDAPDEVGTTFGKLEYIVKTARKTIPGFDLKYTLTSFAGIRATSSTGDFIIEMSKTPGFVQVAGIDSPGLTSSPAVAQRVVDILKRNGLKLREKSVFHEERPPIINKNADGNIICRCEQVTDTEIIDAMHRGLRIDHIDGIKRRTRATMGPCQGNYCTPKIKALIAKELGIAEETVTLRGEGSLPLPPRENRQFWKRLEDK